MSKEYLEITEQLELFKKRGMIIENEEKALEILDLYKLMKKEYQKEIADNHNITVSIFISWLENINLIRNLSAHNSNVLNLKF